MPRRKLMPQLDIEDLIPDPGDGTLLYSVADAMLDIHRGLHPDRHLAYWLTRPESEWPAGFEFDRLNGVPFEYQWTPDTIEWVAQAVEEALKAIDLPVDEDPTPFQQLRRQWLVSKEGDSNDDQVDAANVYIEALEREVGIDA